MTFNRSSDTPTEKTMTKATTKAARAKRKHFVPKKPANFPLTPHASGKWMKSIKSKIYYFGNWGRIKDGVMVRMTDDGRDEALRRYQAFIADPSAKVPVVEAAVDEQQSEIVTADQVTVGFLCNEYRGAKLTKMKAGDIKPGTYYEAKQGTDYLILCFGGKKLVSELGPADFAKLKAMISEGRGPASRGGLINKIKSIFKYGLENDLINKRVKYGSEFKAPNKGEIKKANAGNAKRLFTREEILRILDAADSVTKAQVLLGINNALGANDLGHLRFSHIDLKNGFLDYPRVKNGNERRSKMWPETVAALKEVIANRPEPKDKKHADLVFLNRRGLPVVRDNQKWRGDLLVGVSHVDGVGPKFLRLLRTLHIKGRKRLGHYTLRHTFRTQSDAQKDFSAIRLVMGHSDQSIDSTYTHGISDSRLAEVAAFVREWLYGK